MEPSINAYPYNLLLNSCYPEGTTTGIVFDESPTLKFTASPSSCPPSPIEKFSLASKQQIFRGIDCPRADSAGEALLECDDSSYSENHSRGSLDQNICPRTSLQGVSRIDVGNVPDTIVITPSRKSGYLPPPSQKIFALSGGSHDGKDSSLLTSEDNININKRFFCDAPRTGESSTKHPVIPEDIMSSKINDSTEIDAMIQASLPPPLRSGVGAVGWSRQYKNTKASEGEGVSAEKKHIGLKSPPRRLSLSLSAFRKPETAISLTNADRSRRIEDEYDLSSPRCRVLGHGASSTVRLAIRKRDEALVAVKSIAKHKVLRSSPHRFPSKMHNASPARSQRQHQQLDEYEVLSLLRDSQHPHIASLLDTFETESQVQLVLEYCAGGELFDAIQRRKRTCGGSGYTESHAAQILSQLLSALSHMHSRGIVHRDIKPENVLLMAQQNDDHQDTTPSVPRVKLSDFGLARVLRSPFPRRLSLSSEDKPALSDDFSPNVVAVTPSDSKILRAYSTVGSAFYAAPEVGSGLGYDTSVDVYSLGVTLYILLCGFPPPSCHQSGATSGPKRLTPVPVVGSSSSETDDEHLFYVGESRGSSVIFPKAHWRGISSSAKDLVRRMLHPDPARRITADAALRHEWITKNSHVRGSSSLANLCVPSNAASSISQSDLDLVHLRSKLLDCQQQNRKKKRKRNAINATPTKNIFLAPSKRIKPDPYNNHSEEFVKVTAESLPFKDEPVVSSPQSMAISMVDLYEKMSSVAAAASAAAAGVTVEGEVVQDSVAVVEEDGERARPPSFSLS